MRKLLLITLFFGVVLVGCGNVAQKEPIRQATTQPVETSTTQPVETSTAKIPEIFPTLGGSFTDFERKYGKMDLPAPTIYDNQLHAEVDFSLDDFYSGNVDHINLSFDLGKNEKYSTQRAEKLCSYFMPSDKKLVKVKEDGFKNDIVTWDYGAIFQSDWLANRFPDKEEFATYSDGATNILQYNPLGTFYLLTRPLKNNRGLCVVEVGAERHLVNK